MNGRSQAHWTIFGQQRFPAISVPASLTKPVYDRVPDAASADGTGTRLVRLRAPQHLTTSLAT